VKNRISDIADWLLDQITSPTVPGDSADFCWPLSRNSTVKSTVTRVSFGSPRRYGRSCHSGTDVYTKAPGQVVSVMDGQVVGLVQDYTPCVEGWGVRPDSLTQPVRTAAVLVYNIAEDRTIMYGGLDAEKVKARLNHRVKKGHLLGVASYCGLLHIQLYRGRVDSPHRWPIPEGHPRVPVYESCVDKYPQSRPHQLLDPTDLLVPLEGKFCA